MLQFPVLIYFTHCFILMDLVSILFRTLLDSKLWEIRSTEGFVLFPGSDHVESVVVFDRKGQLIDV